MHQRSTLEIMVASVGGSSDASAFPPGGSTTRVHHGGAGPVMPIFVQFAIIFDMYYMHMYVFDITIKRSLNYHRGHLFG